MPTKKIRVDERVKHWQTLTITVDCPEGETDEQTFQRLREKGLTQAGVDFPSITEVLFDLEEPLEDLVRGTDHTLDFESKGLGVIEKDDEDDE